jgi:predicted transcriptional regulator
LNGVATEEEYLRSHVTSNLSKKRSNLQLIAEILENAKIGSAKTSLMCKVGMSYPQFNEYLEFLNSKGLIESNEGVYQTTSKGVAFVKEYKTLLLLCC